MGGIDKAQTPVMPQISGITPNETETVNPIPVAAAVKTDDGVIHFMPAPHRHHHTVHALNAVNRRAESPIILAAGEQGFVMSDGNFATREDAAEAAINAGLIEALRWPPQLYSEDLW